MEYTSKRSIEQLHDALYDGERDFSDRGSDEEYEAVLEEEYRQLLLAKRSNIKKENESL